MTPDNPEPADLAEVFERALRVAARQAGGRDDLEQVLIDAATDGVLYARSKWCPERGSFAAFAEFVVRKRVTRAKAEHRRRAVAFSDIGPPGDGNAEGKGFDPPAPPKPIGGRIPLSAELRDLPRDLRDAVRFVYVDGYTLEDAGLLLGVSNQTVHCRLRKAAEMLAEDGAVKPERKPKEKRVRGGIGH